MGKVSGEGDYVLTMVRWNCLLMCSSTCCNVIIQKFYLNCIKHWENKGVKSTMCYIYMGQGTVYVRIVQSKLLDTTIGVSYLQESLLNINIVMCGQNIATCPIQQ